MRNAQSRHSGRRPGMFWRHTSSNKAFCIWMTCGKWRQVESVIMNTKWESTSRKRSNLVSVITAVHVWLREMLHPEHERIKMSDPDDASHQHFVNYYRKASKQIFLTWSTLQWGWDIQNTLRRRVIYTILHYIFMQESYLNIN